MANPTSTVLWKLLEQQRAMQELQQQDMNRAISQSSDSGVDLANQRARDYATRQQQAEELGGSYGAIGQEVPSMQDPRLQELAEMGARVMRQKKEALDQSQELRRDIERMQTDRAIDKQNLINQGKIDKVAADLEALRGVMKIGEQASPGVSGGAGELRAGKSRPGGGFTKPGGMRKDRVSELKAAEVSLKNRNAEIVRISPKQYKQGIFGKEGEQITIDPVYKAEYDYNVEQLKAIQQELANLQTGHVDLTAIPPPMRDQVTSQQEIQQAPVQETARDILLKKAKGL